MTEETIRTKAERLSGMLLAAEDLVAEIRREAEYPLWDKVLDIENDIQVLVADVQDMLDSTVNPLPDVTPEEPPLMMQG